MGRRVYRGRSYELCSIFVELCQVPIGGAPGLSRKNMRAIKLQTHVTKDRTLRLTLPDDVQEGPAEVIVLVSEPMDREGHTLHDFLSRLSTRPREVSSKEELDRYLEHERESWD